MKPANSTSIRIGDWRVDPGFDEISREGVAVKLEPRAMRLLLYLSERAGQVVSVQELLDEVWADVVVTSDSVYQAVAALRRLLGDHAREPAYIVTLPRRGYRLIAAVAPVNELESAATAASASANPAVSTPSMDLARSLTRRRLSWLRFTAIAAVSLILLGYVLVQKPWTAIHATTKVAASAPVTNKSIAVLPFVDKSEKKDQEYFADGMAEELVALLAKLPQLSAIGRTSALRFKGSTDDLPAIGAKLGAAYLVTGTVSTAGNRIRVSARLIETRSGNELWADNYDRELGDVLALQDQISTHIARALQVTVTAGAVLAQQHLHSPEAYKLYLRGLSAYDRQRPDALSEAQSYFEQALALDESFLRAAEGLALTHVAQATGETVIPRGAWQKAKESAETAMRIDATSSTAHAVLGLFLGLYQYDWDAADAESGRAMALNPRDPVARDLAARVAHVHGQTDEALRRIGASLSLDPLNPYALQTLGQIFFAKGDLDSAERIFRKLAEVTPAFDGNHYFLSSILIARGDRNAALREAKAEVAVDARDAALAIVYYELGRKAESDAALGRILSYSRDIWPNGIATVYARRGEADKAFQWFDRSCALRDPETLMFIRSDFLVARLRGDPRYKALLAKMNLTE